MTRTVGIKVLIRDSMGSVLVTLAVQSRMGCNHDEAKAVVMVQTTPKGDCIALG